MPKAYLVAKIRVHDNERFEEFRKLSGSVIAEHGGRVLVRHPTGDHREGDLRRTVFEIEFDDKKAARRFQEPDASTAARLVREQAAETELLLVEGMA